MCELLRSKYHFGYNDLRKFIFSVEELAFLLLYIMSDINDNVMKAYMTSNCPRAALMNQMKCINLLIKDKLRPGTTLRGGQ